jgi:gas vesicle protein GvpL/GvpF
MTAKGTRGTYVYCVIASSRAPALPRMPKGLPGAGPVRLLDLDAGVLSRRSGGFRRWLVVADVPLDRYGEQAIKAGLSDLDWVSRAAVAHEAVVECFVAAAGLLPMKLFTIFKSDDRALEYIRQQGRRIDDALARVLKHEEWGVRVVLGAPRVTVGSRRTLKRSRTVTSGSSYLERKKAQRDAAVELAERARDVVAELYDRFAQRSSIARRRTLTEVAGQRAPLLLDAVFLVARARASSFRAAAQQQARRLEPEGYLISLTGPWPPYSFVQD